MYDCVAEFHLVVALFEDEENQKKGRVLEIALENSRTGKISRMLTSHFGSPRSAPKNRGSPI